MAGRGGSPEPPEVSFNRPYHVKRFPRKQKRPAEAGRFDPASKLNEPVFAYYGKVKGAKGAARSPAVGVPTTSPRLEPIEFWNDVPSVQPVTVAWPTLKTAASPPFRTVMKPFTRTEWKCPVWRCHTRNYEWCKRRQSPDPHLGPPKLSGRLSRYRRLASRHQRW